MQQIVRISFSFVFLSFFVLCDNVALDIPKGDATKGTQEDTCVRQ